MIVIYGCTKENNECSKKEECKRYIEENEFRATLFKEMCTKNNNNVLFIKYIEKEDGV